VGQKLYMILHFTLFTRTTDTIVCSCYFLIRIGQV